MGGYSTGMKQRVKLAQALVHDPRLLLLDEPTNGLDPAGRDEMLDLVHRTGTEFGIAIIMASHLLGEIERVCDFLVAIDAGRLLRAAPLETFTQQTGALIVEVDEGSDRARRTALRTAACRRRRRRPPGPRRDSAMARTTRPRRGRGPRTSRSSASSRAAAASRTCSVTASTGRGRGCRRAAGRRARGMTDTSGLSTDRSADAAARAASTTSATAATRVRGSGRRGAIARAAHPLPAHGLGARSQRAFEDRAGRARLLFALLPSLAGARHRRGHLAARAPPARRIEALSPIRYSSLFPIMAILVIALLRGPGTGAVRSRPARRRAAALLLAGDRRASTTPRRARSACSRSLAFLVLTPQLHPPRRAHPRVADDVLDGIAQESAEPAGDPRRRGSLIVRARSARSRPPSRR